MSVTLQNKLADRARSSILPNRRRQSRLLHRQGDQRGYGKGVLHEQRGVDDVAVGGTGARLCCFPSCDRRSAHATEHLV